LPARPRAFSHGRRRQHFAINTLAPYVLTALVPAGRLPQDLWLPFGIAHRWPTVRSNAVEPGWVATQMGGPGAPDDLAAGATTQTWLATSTDPAASVTGGYFYHQAKARVLPAARDPLLQDELLALCAKLSGVDLRG